jgi:hypothetical protein
VLVAYEDRINLWRSMGMTWWQNCSRRSIIWSGSCDILSSVYWLKNAQRKGLMIY